MSMDGIKIWKQHPWSTAGPLRALLIILVIFCFAHIVYAETFRRDIAIELEPVEGAESYDFELLRSGRESNSAQIVRVKEPTWKGRLKPGSYRIRLRSRDQRGIAGDWSPPMDLQVPHPAPVIVEPIRQQQFSSKEPTVRIPIKVEFDALDKIKWTLKKANTPISEGESDSAQTTISAPSGEVLTLEIVAQHQDGASSEIQSLEITTIGPQLETPADYNVPTEQSSTLKWGIVEGSDSYGVDISKLTSRSPASPKQVQAKSPQLSVAKWSDGAYRLNVRATGQRKIASEPSTKFLRVKEGRILELSDSLDELNRKSQPSIWRLDVQIGVLADTFKGENQDLGTKTDFQGAQGVGAMLEAEKTALWKNLGVYFFGGFGHTEVNSPGDGQNLAVDTFAGGGELRLRMPHSLLSGGSWVLGGGASYEETPEYLSSIDGTNSGAQFLQVIGWRLTLTSDLRFTSKWRGLFEVSLTSPLASVAVPQDGELSNNADTNMDIRTGVQWAWDADQAVGLGYKYGTRKYTYKSRGVENRITFERSFLAGWYQYQF